MKATIRFYKLLLPSRRVLISLVLALLLILATPLPRVFAVTNPGATTALINPGQLTRDASSAIPVVGFGMTSTTTTDRLLSVRISFSGTGFRSGDDQTLRRLRSDPSTSGVALYRESGPVVDALDAGDTGVSPSGISWTGNDVIMDFSGVNEPVPTSIAGQFQWIIVIRTSAVTGALADGDTIITTIKANNIVASSGVGTTTQPTLADVVSNALTIRLTRAVDMVPGGKWVGSDRVRVNSTAVLGFTIVDGSIAVNRGISDNITQITIRLDDASGSVTSGSLKPITTNGATSGIGLYIDNGAIRGQWDPGDTPVTLASISPTIFAVGGVDITMTMPAPGLKVPSGSTAALDFFFVIRTRNILTGDEFSLELRPGSIVVKGILGVNPASVDASLQTPLIDGALGSSPILGDSTPPMLRNLAWVSASPYAFASGLNLYFSHAMTSTQTAFASGQARDDQSGLATVTFSSAPSLASSPPPMTVTGAGTWRAFNGGYGISATSTGASSPVDVTVSDQVGNSIDVIGVLGTGYNFTFISSSILVVPSPGWQAGGQSSLWVAPNGKLWFSNLMTTNVPASLTVSVGSLDGFPLSSASFSAASSLAGNPNPSSFAFAAGTFSTTLTVNYIVNSQSTGASSPVTLTVADTSGATSTMSFPFGLDNQPPSITITAPLAAPAISGNFVPRATVSDALTGVASVQFQIDSTGVPVNALFDGTAYFLPFSSILFPDGAHRIIVRSTDTVGNLNVASIDVVFTNGATTPPSIRIALPADSQRESGLVLFEVAVSAVSGVKNVTITVFGQAKPMVFNAATGHYTYNVDSGNVANGQYQATITATDQAGRTSTSTVSFQVTNAAPPLVNTTFLFELSLAFLAVAFVVSILLARKWFLPKLRKTSPTTTGPTTTTA
jgi:hypothetical protein